MNPDDASINFDNLPNIDTWNKDDKLSFYEWVFDKIPATIYVNDVNKQHAVWGTPEFARMTGHTIQSMIEMGPMKFYQEFYHPDDFEVLEKSVRVLLTSDGPCSCVYRLKDTKGDWRWYYSIFSVTKKNLDNTPWITIGIAIDFTERFFSEKQLEELLKENARLKHKLKVNTLTKRERQILQIFAKGNTIKETAHELCISFHTVDTHRKNLQKKLNAKNMAALTKFAIEAGL